MHYLISTNKVNYGHSRKMLQKYWRGGHGSSTISPNFLAPWLYVLTCLYKRCFHRTTQSVRGGVGPVERQQQNFPKSYIQSTHRQEWFDKWENSSERPSGGDPDQSEGSEAYGNRQDHPPTPPPVITTGVSTTSGVDGASGTVSASTSSWVKEVSVIYDLQTLAVNARRGTGQG